MPKVKQKAGAAIRALSRKINEGVTRRHLRKSSAGTEVPPRNLGRSQIRGGVKVREQGQGPGNGRETWE